MTVPPDPAATEELSEAARRTTGEAVIRGGLWTTVSGLLPQLYTLAVSVAAARLLGPELLGRQSFIAFVSLSFVTLCSAGLSIALMRAVAEAFGRGAPERARGLARWTWKVALAAAAGGGAIVIVPALAGAEHADAWLLAGLVTFLSVLQSVPNAALIGMHRWREASIVGLVTGALGVPAIIGVLEAGGGVAGMFAVEAAIAAVNLVWALKLSLGALRAAAPATVAPDREMRRSTARFAGVTTISAVLTLVVWRRSEFFFLERFSSDTELALYSIAFAAATVLASLPERLGSVMSSAFATLIGARALDRVRAGYGRTQRLLVLLALPLVALSAALGPATIRLVYGEEFADSGTLLVVLLVTVPVVPLWNTSASLLTGFGDARSPLKAGVAAAAINVALALALVPSLDALGAALANAGAQAAAGLIMFALASRRVATVWHARHLAHGVVVSAAAGLGAWGVVQGVGGVAGVVLGLAAGLALLVVLGRILPLLSPEDGRWLEGTLGGRAGALVRALTREAAPVP